MNSDPQVIADKVVKILSLHLSRDEWLELDKSLDAGSYLEEALSDYILDLRKACASIEIEF